MGAMELDTEQEFKILEALSTSSCSKYTSEAKNHALDLDAMLEMLEVRLVTVKPYRE